MNAGAYRLLFRIHTHLSLPVVFRSTVIEFCELLQPLLNVRLCVLYSSLSLASTMSGVVLVHFTFLFVLCSTYFTMVHMTSVSSLPSVCLVADELRLNLSILILVFVSAGFAVPLRCNKKVCLVVV